MITEVVKAGMYKSALWQKEYPRIQILTIEELLKGIEVKMPPAYSAFKKAEKVKKEGLQDGLGL